MKNFWVSLCYLFPAIIAIILVLLTPIPSAQLTTTENTILLQVQKLLGYPQVLQEWSNVTNFCYLPPSPSLKILCSNGHVTELTIIGNRTKPERFSLDSLFTALTKLSNIKVLSLVSLGLWGPLPYKINRFNSLEVMNLSSNFIFGEIPPSMSSLKNLRSLILDHNLFSKSVPDLRRLASLEEINLSFNKLGPEFPSLSNNLVRIVLKNNSFRCPIPNKRMQVHKLQVFDISSNEISGNIPSFLFSLPSLQYLNLASNQISGSISMNISCSSALTFVDISHNFLVGKLPSCVGSKSSNRTVLYSWNCLSTRRLSDQHPSSYCKKLDALAVKPPHRSQKKEWKKQLGLIVVAIGGVVGISVILVLFIRFILRKSKAERADGDMDKSSALAYPNTNVNTRRIPQPQMLPVLGFPPYNTFTLEEIEDATNNFDPSKLISEGPQGQLYKGYLRDGSKVMINRVKLRQKNLSKNSVQNLKVLPYLRHRHLVSVLGHCLITYHDRPQATSTLFIVFEHVSSVSLRDYLTDRRRKEMLKWPQRMVISTGIVRGIQFLHTGVNPGIFGNNIKIENVLLDDSLNAKVSGYSIPLPSKKGFDSKLSEQSATNHIGSMNPAEKEDIYQLGVILLEVITGKPITSSSEVEELRNELEIGLSEVASPILWGASDPSLRGTYGYESLRTAVQITISCLSNVSSNRPSIEDILWNLQYSMQVQESRTSSGNLNTRL